MNRRFISVSQVFVIAALVLSTHHSRAAEPHQFNCYSVIVGKDASSDGSVLVAHNEDDRDEQIMNIYKVPGQEYTERDSIRLKNGGVIPQAKTTHGYLWIQLPRMQVADAFVNEKGVVIASDACYSREDNPELTDGGILYWLRRLVAERAGTAREGVELAGRLIDAFGYASSGRTYIIADSLEGWMFAVVNGKHWIAQRVPDDHVAVIPNNYTIGEIDLADTTRFLGSSDIIEYAQQRGWYDPEKDGAFHFAMTYAVDWSCNHPGNTRRMARGLNLLSGKEYKESDSLPFSFKPEKKVSIADLKSVLRDHYENSHFDKSDHYRLGNPHALDETTICDLNTQFSMIVHLRNDRPAEIGTVLWLAPYRPCVQAYTPWFPGIQSVPTGYAYTDQETALRQHFDPPESVFEKNDTHHFWKFVQRVEQTDTLFSELINIMQERYMKIEGQIEREMNAFEKKVLELYPENPEKARQMLTDFSAKWAMRVIEPFQPNR